MGPDPPIVAHRERRALNPTSPPRAGPCHTSVFARDAVTAKKAADARLGRPVAQSLRARARLRELLHDRLPLAAIAEALNAGLHIPDEARVNVAARAADSRLAGAGRRGSGGSALGPARRRGSPTHLLARRVPEEGRGSLPATSPCWRSRLRSRRPATRPMQRPSARPPASSRSRRSSDRTGPRARGSRRRFPRT